MRSQMQVTAPVLIACSALLLCIGVIAGLTGSLLLQQSKRPALGGVTAAAPMPTAAGSGVAMPALPMASALVPDAPATASITPTLPTAGEIAPPAPALAPQITAPAATALPVAPSSILEVPQPPAAAAQDAPTMAGPMVGEVTSAAEAQGNEVDPATFQGDLQPMGQWVATPDYGDCWAPQGVPAGWRPYTEGRWVYTECGWTWVSDEPWGYITYHYGSWVDYPGYGWIWVPGRVWAPAWVAWRVGGGYVGWAPLPPAACRRDIPVAEAVVMRIPPSYFSFVGEVNFCDDRVGRHMRPVHQNVTIILQTRNSTHMVFGHTGVVNRCMSVEQVHHMTGRRPPQVHLARSDNHHDAEQRGRRGEPVAYRPRPKSPPAGPVAHGGGDHQRPPSLTPWPTPRNAFATQGPVARPADPSPAKPTPKPPSGAPWPAPRSPVATQGPVARPSDPSPAKPAPKPTPAKAVPPSQPPAWSTPRSSVAAQGPVARPADPSPAKPAPQPTPEQPKPPVARPADPEARPADAQPAPAAKPTRDHGKTDTPAADKPTSPPAARPADAPRRRPAPEPTPVPEKRRERAPEQASPPAARPANPAPTRQETRVQQKPSETPQRGQPAKANTPADDQRITPGQNPANATRGGGARRGGQ